MALIKEKSEKNNNKRKIVLASDKIKSILSKINMAFINAINSDWDCDLTYIRVIKINLFIRRKLKNFLF